MACSSWTFAEFGGWSERKYNGKTGNGLLPSSTAMVTRLLDAGEFMLLIESADSFGHASCGIMWCKVFYFFLFEGHCHPQKDRVKRSGS